MCFPLSIAVSASRRKSPVVRRDESIRCIMRLVSTGQDGAVVGARLTAG